MNESNTYQSALFITLALDAEARCEPGWTPDAVTSVVMAFMAMEAFVNEVASVATVLTKQDEKIRLLTEELREYRAAGKLLVERKRKDADEAKKQKD